MFDMGFLYTSLPLWLAIGGNLAAVALLVPAAWKKPFARLHDDTLQHLWLGMTVAIAVMWATNAWLNDGPVMHLLGATLMVTLFGWSLALVSMAAICALVAAIFGTPWEGVGLTFVIFGAVPVCVSMLLQRAIAAWLPRNLLVFIFGHGFVTAALALGVACAAALGLHLVLAHGDTAVIPPGYGIAVGMLASGEAWFCGMLTALFAVYRPAWVTTYDVRRYRFDRRHVDRGPRA
ncbi:putative membrane protein [Mycetohabitans endofungorum]|uniref:Putative membrane protein n=2 Tax=Burkholderiaceae TaxID=119060 RepID=A0A2P5K8T1_9BURK|nr:putative membrane protein [Mycetohabitans endofungorum]